MHGDMKSALEGMFGREYVHEIYYVFKNKDIYHNEEFEDLFKGKLKDQNYDFVLSTNFFPVIARICNEEGIPYFAWSYDTPMNVLPCEEMRYDTNFIFLFDKLEVARYKELGFGRFYHLPLAVNTGRYDTFKPSGKYTADISFMGKLYRSTIPYIKDGLSEALVGYIDKLISIQRQTIGKYIVDDLISQPIIAEMNRQYAESGKDLTIIKEQLSYAVSAHVTYLDRVILLEMLARRFDTHLYTYDIGDTEKGILKNVKIHGPLNYYTEMPIMFKSSKINLNGSFRAAKSAIPMRALDIMGCGGFLLTSVQPEYEDYFDNGKELVMYHSEEEAVELSDYYLKHDDERKKVAAAGYEKVKKAFRYEDRFNEMLRVAGVNA